MCHVSRGIIIGIIRVPEGEEREKNRKNIKRNNMYILKTTNQHSWELKELQVGRIQRDP